MKRKNKGERLTATDISLTMLEHLHRYGIALNHVAGKRVLDIACGEGYGSHLMAKKAAHVIGVDIDEQVIQDAQEKYIAPNLRFVQGDVTKIPIEDATIDVVISFETIEHTAHHTAMMTEVRRVMKENGVLIISSPDKKYYSDLSGYNNPFHVKELYHDEFIDLIQAHFKNIYRLYQKPILGSFIFTPGNRNTLLEYYGDSNEVAVKDSNYGLYLIIVASNTSLDIPPTASFFSSQEVMYQSSIKQFKNTLKYKIKKVVFFPYYLIKSLLKR